jgi:hypothetical protein
MSTNEKEREETHDINDPDCLLHGGFYLWPDGSKKQDDYPYHQAVVIPPSDDAHKAARAVLFYWRTRLSQAVAAFDERKHGLQSWAFVSQRDGSPPPGEKNLAELEVLRLAVEHCKKMFSKAERKVEATTPEHIKGRREDINRNKAAGQDVTTKLSNITV